jgi:phospholipase/lecithinase/hemolysin
MNSTLRTILLEANTPPKRHWISVLDLQKEFEAVSKNNITGQAMLVDHVHPTIAAHQLIAQIITKHLQRSKWIQQSLSWEVDIVDEFENVIQSLDFGYFKRAKDRLESVKKWSRGQAIDPLKEPVNRNTESTQ